MLSIGNIVVFFEFSATQKQVKFYLNGSAGLFTQVFFSFNTNCVWASYGIFRSNIIRVVWATSGKSKIK